MIQGDSAKIKGRPKSPLSEETGSIYSDSPSIEDGSVSVSNSSYLYAKACNRFGKYWEPDSATSKCRGCEKKFTLASRRRHHCRRCGFLFCGSCSRWEILFAPNKSRRSCFDCLVFFEVINIDADFRRKLEDDIQQIPFFSQLTTAPIAKPLPTTLSLTELPTRTFAPSTPFSDGSATPVTSPYSTISRPPSSPFTSSTSPPSMGLSSRDHIDHTDLNSFREFRSSLGVHRSRSSDIVSAVDSQATGATNQDDSKTDADTDSARSTQIGKETVELARNTDTGAVYGSPPLPNNLTSTVVGSSESKLLQVPLDQIGPAILSALQMTAEKFESLSMTPLNIPVEKHVELADKSTVGGCISFDSFMSMFLPVFIESKYRLADYWFHKDKEKLETKRDVSLRAMERNIVYPNSRATLWLFKACYIGDLAATIAAIDQGGDITHMVNLESTNEGNLDTLDWRWVNFFNVCPLQSMTGAAAASAKSSIAKGSVRSHSSMFSAMVGSVGLPSLAERADKTDIDSSSNRSINRSMSGSLKIFHRSQDMTTKADGVFNRGVSIEVDDDKSEASENSGRSVGNKVSDRDPIPQRRNSTDSSLSANSAADNDLSGLDTNQKLSDAIAALRCASMISAMGIALLRGHQHIVTYVKEKYH